MKQSIQKLLALAIDAHKASQLTEAYELYATVLRTVPKHPIANFNRGIIAESQGKSEEAIKHFASAAYSKPEESQFWCGYVNALLKNNKTDRAIEILSEANESCLSVQNFFGLYFNIALKLMGRGDFDLAITYFETSFNHNPKFADAQNEIGRAYINKGEFQNAKRFVQRAIEIQPDLVRAHNNLGIIEIRSGDFLGAIVHLERGLKYEPKNLDLLDNLAIALLKCGKYAEVIELSHRALAIEPHHWRSFCNLGHAFFATGELYDAARNFDKAICFIPDLEEAWSGLGEVFKVSDFTRRNVVFEQLAVKLLERKTMVRPKDIVRSCLSLLRFHPNLESFLVKNINLFELDCHAIMQIGDIALLRDLIKVCPLPDLEFENLLTKVRSEILLTKFEPKVSNKILPFVSALAIQCFINEFIYSETDEERRKVEKLSEEIKLCVENNIPPNPNDISILACYRALDKYPWSNAVIFQESLSEIQAVQIDEPREEASIRDKIPALGQVVDTTSKNVMNQYEENPYPRWVYAPVSKKPIPMTTFLRELSLDVPGELKFNDTNPEILIAGCGTGQQSIATASRILNCEVLAIDLSFASLSYAKRKSDELGVTNISYLQADILDLAQLERKFDLIECVGVLHHMENPMDGWRILTERLNSDGIMKIGLYSAAARCNLPMLGSSGEESKAVCIEKIIKKRADIIRTSQNPDIINSGDFYTVSTLRDLLFHAKEHRFTIDQLQECLAELNLKFIGFELSKRTLRRFEALQEHPQEKFNISAWHGFEQANRDTFGSMYQFWCRKA